MKQEQKSELARRRILDAAMKEFSLHGYDGASLNAACAENGISKGIVYHHFKDKNELYLLCIKACFDDLTAYLKASSREFLPEGPTAGDSVSLAEDCLKKYFHARLHFFADHPLYLGIFIDACMQPVPALSQQIKDCRRPFDQWNLEVLTRLFSEKPLRNGIAFSDIEEDLRMYMDYFNMRFYDTLSQGGSPAAILKKHEEMCRRQIDILLHGILGE